VGGKSHEFVVSLLGVGAGPQGVADDGVFIDAGEAGGLADATAVLEVLEDGEGLALREAGGEQGGAFALGEAGLAGAADEHPALLAAAVAEADAEVVAAAQSEVSAVGVLAAEEAEVVHGRHPLTTGRAVDRSHHLLYNCLWMSATLGGHYHFFPTAHR
jgi:hypothetical protein